ncbi:hypothetical protein DPMN_131672 [Dreissena polymorpha]|uniref:Uncharacterized protein n=1 Tax=Dreissena polymorpha TaxID=45954 RepID=A0A9D4FUR5_DREPO|nr:hypothetical protein DPMN_131672 [Dreissena polymorpha]
MTTGNSKKVCSTLNILTQPNTSVIAGADGNPLAERCRSPKQDSTLTKGWCKLSYNYTDTPAALHFSMERLVALSGHQWASIRDHTSIAIAINSNNSPPYAMKEQKHASRRKDNLEIMVNSTNNTIADIIMNGTKIQILGSNPTCHGIRSDGQADQSLGPWTLNAETERRIQAFEHVSTNTAPKQSTRPTITLSRYIDYIRKL